MEDNVAMFINKNLDGIEVIQLKRLPDFLGDYHTAKAINFSETIPVLFMMLVLLLEWFDGFSYTI